MITPSFAITATERVLPKLALDFTTASLDSRITFTRALNTATRVNSSGLIETVNADTPRFDYDSATLVCKGLLIEESRSNIITQSAFASNWTFNASASFGATTTAPDGGTAQVLTDNSASASGQVYQLVPFVSGTVYSFSFYIKAVNRTLGQVVSFTQSGTFTFDLSGSGSVGTPSGVFTNPSITAFNNGWFRISVTLTATATGNGNLGFSTNSNAFTGNAWALWGAQLEVGAFPTSYIPTTTTALTRNADVATMTGTNFSSWYNSSQNTLAFSGALEGFGASSVHVLAQIGSSTNAFNDRVALQVSSGAFNYTVTNSSGTNQCAINNQTATANTNFKVSGGGKTDDFGIATNTILGTKDTSGTFANVAPTMLYIGSRFGGNFMNGWVKQISCYTQKLTDAELQSITK